MVRSFLPMPISVIIETPALGLKQVRNLPGKGSDIELNCMGDANLSRKLYFQMR